MIIVPVADTKHFHGCEVIHREQNLAAGDTTSGRSRSAFASEEAFLEAVALGIADQYTFETLAEAARFAEKKLSEMVKAAKELKRNRSALKRSPKRPYRSNQAPTRNLPEREIERNTKRIS